jgi:SAM-dependent methyltransferase
MTTIDPPGSAAVHGQEWGGRARDWAEIQEWRSEREYETVFERMRVGSATRYCDVGCASGVAALLASRRGARVSGLDAADRLIEIACARLPSGDFRVGEMEELPFEDRTFDLVTGFHSFNYETRPHVALAEARRIAKPDGRIVMTTWGRVETMGVAALINALTPLLPSRPPSAPGIYALSEEAPLRALAESAGLEPLSVDYIDCTWSYPDIATALRAWASSGRAVRTIELTSEAAVNAAHAAALAPFLQSDGTYQIDASLICLIARP